MGGLQGTGARDHHRTGSVGGLWLTGSTLESVLHLPATLLSSAVVAIGAVALLSIEEIVDWNDLKGVNWGVFFVIGAGLTLGDALGKTGASAWVADQIAPSLIGLALFHGVGHSCCGRLCAYPIHEQCNDWRDYHSCADYPGPGGRN